MEEAKKFGAGLIIIILAVMMGVFMFSGLTIGDMQSVLTGGGRFGSFDGESFRQDEYVALLSQCEERERQMMQQFGGEIPSFFQSEMSIENCLRRRFQQVYVYGSIGERLAQDITNEEIQREMIEQAQMMFDAQTNPIEAHRMTLEELYARQEEAWPRKLRRKEHSARGGYQALAEAFYVPTRSLNLNAQAEEIVFDLDVIQYDEARLLERFKATVELSEDQIRAEFDREQAELPEERQQPYDKERPFVIARLKNKLASESVQQLKQRLNDLGPNFTLEQVTEVTNVEAETARNVRLAGLGSVEVGTRTVDLALADLFADIASGKEISGPHEVGERTYFVGIGSIQIPPVDPMSEEELTAAREEQGQAIAGTFSSLVYDEELERGGFELVYVERR